MALPAAQRLDLIGSLVSAGFALVRRTQPPPIVLQNLLDKAIHVDLHKSLSSVMLLISRHEAGEEISSAHVAQAIIEDGQRLEEHVSSWEGQLLRYMRLRLSELIGSIPPPKPSSGIFCPGEVSERMATDDLVEQQFSEVMHLTVGGAIHDANNTLTILKGVQTLLKKDMHTFFAIEADFAEFALESVLEIDAHIEGILEEVRDLHRDSLLKSGDLKRDENRFRKLAAPGGHIERICLKLKSLRRDLDLLLSRFRQETLEEPMNAYRVTLIGRIEEIGELVERALEVLEGMDCKDSLNPVPLEKYLKPGILRSILGKAVELQLDLNHLPSLVPGPSKSAWQVIINLVTNAREAMEGKGSLLIESRKEWLSDVEAAHRNHDFMTGAPSAGEFVVLSIRDTGPGIPQDVIPRIFDLFYTGRKSSGYGLAVTRKVIEDMGGVLGVDSNIDGSERGTTFTIYFPRSQ